MSMLATALTTIVLFGGDYGEWVVDVQSFGEDVNWESPSTVRTDAVFYYRYHNVTAIDAWVSYLGFEFGPFDVLYMIDDTDDEGLGFGPLPLDFPYIEFLTPEPPEPLAVRFDFNTWMTADGHLGVGVDNVEFGTAEYDLGWPFGTVTVTVEGIGLAAAISITASDDLCVGDMDGNGVVDTNDLLAVIGGWGECPADLEVCSGDGTLDGYVDIVDLLWVIGQFGPCP